MKINEFNKRVKLNNGIDRLINGWKIIDVHLIPEKFDVYSEIDFYCCYNEKVYLLRIRQRNERKLSIVDDKNLEQPIYLIAEYNFEKFDNQILAEILAEFEKKIDNKNCT